jgi:hypothetical protein
MSYPVEENKGFKKIKYNIPIRLMNKLIGKLAIKCPVAQIAGFVVYGIVNVKSTKIMLVAIKSILARSHRASITSNI